MQPSTASTCLCVLIYSLTSMNLGRQIESRCDEFVIHLYCVIDFNTRMNYLTLTVEFENKAHETLSNC